MSARKKMTREALYELVWSMTMRDAASDMGVSDVALLKYCRRRAIPTPPRGYWNKVRAGHRMGRRPALPPPPLPKPPKQSPVVPTNDAPVLVERRVGRSSAQSERGASAGKKGRKRAVVRKLTDERYVMAIERWEWNYGFGINMWKRQFGGHYSDRRTLNVYGTFLRPVALAGAKASLEFLPANMDNRTEGRDGPTTDIGWLAKRRDGSFESLLFMPEDALPSLLQMLIGGKLRFVVLDGLQLLRGRTDIREFSFRADWSAEADENA